MREERRETGGVSEEWSAYRLVVVEEERAVVLHLVNSYFSGKLCFGDKRDRRAPLLQDLVVGIPTVGIPRNSQDA